MPAYGDLVIIVTPKGKRSLRRVDENQDMHTQDGILRMADVVEAPFGSEVCTTLGVPYRIQKPTLNDIVKGVKRQTQILYPKDIGYICMRLGVGPNRTVIEAGTGSGSLTVALSWFSGTTGKVHTFEAREEFHKLARRNLEWAGVGQNVTMHCQDIAEGFGDVTGADALFLDVRTPWGLFEAHPRRRDARRCAGVPPAHRGSGRQAPPRAGAGALRRRRSLRNPRAPLEAHRGSPAPRRPHGGPYRFSHFRPPSGTLGEVGRMPHRVARHP